MVKKYPHVKIANQYARDIVAKKTKACKWVILACERHIKDLGRIRDRTFKFELDKDKAERICDFIELLPHIKGEWAKIVPGNPTAHLINLEPWQVFILVSVFGWVHKETGFRKYKTVYIEVPRKNAKSTITSGVGLYMLTADGEQGAECYSAATTRDQAKIVFKDAQTMARKSPDFRDHFGIAVQAHNLNVLSTASKFEALSADSNTLDGLNVHFAGIDELHAHKTREVFDVLETGTGARRQPLLWCITTAGSNRAGICYEQRTYLTKILQGISDDESYFGVIYTIDDDDDWSDPDCWEKANPNYGVSVKPDDIARTCHKALQMPSAQNNFLTKRLNVWVNADTSWMDMRKWDQCADPALVIDDFIGDRAWIALDLASKVDLAVKVTIFERDGHYYSFLKSYLPEDTAENGSNSQYSGWAIDGRLITTPGNVIDYDYIKTDLRDDVSKFEIAAVPYDPFQATQLSVELLQEGFPMVEVRPTVLNFSEAMKELEALVLSKRWHHDADPVMTWMISNVVCHRDAKDNIYPRKEREENKIDGVVATIMALSALFKELNPESVYNERGLAVI